VELSKLFAKRSASFHETIRIQEQVYTSKFRRTIFNILNSILAPLLALGITHTGNQRVLDMGSALSIAFKHFYMVDIDNTMTMWRRKRALIIIEILLPLYERSWDLWFQKSSIKDEWWEQHDIYLSPLSASTYSLSL